MEAPFTETDGARLMAALRFDADNTIAGRPMVDMLTQVAHMLDAARARAGSGALSAFLAASLLAAYLPVAVRGAFGVPLQLLGML